MEYIIDTNLCQGSLTFPYQKIKVGVVKDTKNCHNAALAQFQQSRKNPLGYSYNTIKKSSVVRDKNPTLNSVVVTQFSLFMRVLTAIEMQLSSLPEGNLTTNLDPAFSSESLRGRNRHTTLMLSSAAISRSPDIFSFHTPHNVINK